MNTGFASLSNTILEMQDFRKKPKKNQKNQNQPQHKQNHHYLIPVS